MSTSTAERVEGGWLISGHKIFGSLSPVWIHLGVHAMVLAGDTVIDPPILSSLFRRRRQHDPLGDLSTCERDVLALVAEGLSNKAIGERFHIDDRTVEAHVTAIFLKLHLDEVPGSHRRVLAVLTFLRA